MIDLFKKHVLWKWLVYIRHLSLMTQEMFNEAVHIDPWLLCDVLDNLKTQEICNEAIEKVPWLVFHVSDRFRNLRIIRRAIHLVQFITPGHPKAQRACEGAVEASP